jgi:hypothetical protein
LADGFPGFQEYLLRKIFCQIRVIAKAVHTASHSTLTSPDNLFKSLNIASTGKGDHDRFGSLDKLECR